VEPHYFEQAKALTIDLLVAWLARYKAGILPKAEPNELIPTYIGALVAGFSGGLDTPLSFLIS
jgi:hypothetical protein